MSKNNNTQKIVGLGLFTAIVIVLQLMGSFIRFGTFSISLVLVPVVIGAALYGAGAGAWLGFVFGVVVLLSGDAAAFLGVNALGTILTVLVKGTLAGLLSGLVYKALENKNRTLAVAVAAVVCPVVNTGVFLIGCLLFFMETIGGWADAMGFGANVGQYMIVGLVGANFIFELLFNAAGLTVDTLRTFFLVVLSILGPLSFALSVYDGFQGTLTHWLSKYICVYLWLPVADLFSAVLAKIQVLMLQADIAALQDPSYIPDGSNGVYIIFLIIGIIGYFTVPTAAEWIVQAGGGSGLGGVNRASSFAAGVAGGVTGALIGKAFGRGDKSKYGESDDSGLRGDNLATKDGGGSSGGH